MDVKFIIIILVALAIVFLLINEINALKLHFEKKFNGIDTVLEKHNDDLKTTFKKETNKHADKYVSYTNEMLQQMRKMNNIERQAVMMSDHFIEGFYGDEDRDNNTKGMKIPYLSDTNQKQYHNKQNDVDNKKESTPYMSPTTDNDPENDGNEENNDGDDEFYIKDENNNILNSTKVPSLTKPDSKTKVDSKSKIALISTDTKINPDALDFTNDNTAMVKGKNKDKGKNSGIGMSMSVPMTTLPLVGKVTSSTQNKNKVSSREDKMIGGKNTLINNKIQNNINNNNNDDDEEGSGDDENSNVDIIDESDDFNESLDDETNENESNESDAFDDDANDDDENDDDENDDAGSGDADNIVDSNDENDNEDTDDVSDDEIEDNEEDETDIETEDNEEESVKHKISSKKTQNRSLKHIVPPTPKKEHINKKLQQLKKIQASMQSDVDMESQAITIGSSKKGKTLSAKFGKRKVQDDISVITNDSANFKLKAVTSYKKSDLINIAKRYGAKVTDGMTKEEIHGVIKKIKG